MGGLPEDRTDKDLASLFFGMFNTAPIGMAVLSSDDGWQIINPALGKLLGYKKNELGRIDFRTLIAPTGGGGGPDGSAGYKKKKVSAYQNETEYINKKGRTVRVLQTVTSVNLDGKPLLIYQITDLPRPGRTRAPSVDTINERLSKKSRYDSILRNILQAIHSTIDLQEVIEKAVSVMSENINVADNVTIYMVDGEHAVIRAYRGFDEEFINRVRKIPRSKGFTWKTIMEGRVQYCADTAKDRSIGPSGREYGIRSYVSMPVRINGTAVGCININSTRKNAFSRDELELLEDIARHIELAIGNADKAEHLRLAKMGLEEQVENRTNELADSVNRLNLQISEHTRALNRLNLLRRISTILSGRTEFRGAVRKILKELCKSLDAEVSELWIQQQDSPEKLVRAESVTTLRGKGSRKFMSIRKNAVLGIKNVPGRAMKSGKVVLIAKISEYREFPGRREAVDLGLVNMFSFALRIDGTSVGAINIFLRREIIPAPDFFDTMASLGHDIGQAMAKSRILESLRESESRFRVMADSAPVMIWRTDNNRKFTWFNRAWQKYTGKSLNDDDPVEIWLDTIHPEDRHAFLEHFHRAFEKREQFEMEYRMIDAEKRIRWVVSRGTPLFDSPEEFSGYIGSCLDIHETKTSEVWARRRLKIRENLLNEIHHRIKNNLQMVSDMIEIQFNAVTDERARNALKDTRNRLLTIARIHRRLQAQEITDVSSQIENLVRDVVSITTSERDSVKFELGIESIRLDPDEIVMICFIVNELFTNSVKHAYGKGEQGLIKIELKTKKGNHITLSIADDGRGLPEGFDIDSQDSLGLKIVKVFAQALGGKLKVEKRKKGAGFSVSFPKRSATEKLRG